MEIWRNLKKNKDLLNDAARSRAFILFDTETTGLKKTDEIIELAAQKCYFHNGEFQVYDKLHLYLKPGKPVPEEAIAVHGISNEFLSDKPTAEQCINSIQAFFGENPVVGAYSSGFDIRMMKGLYEKCGKKFQVGLEIDVLKIVRDVFCQQKMPDHKLGTIAATYGVDEGITFHSAMDDVTVMLRVVNSLLKDMLENGISKEDELLKFNLYKLSFYKGYRGRSRLYAITSGGSFYYDIKDDKWFPQDKERKMDRVDMAYLEKQVFEKAGCENYKELKKKCSNGDFSSKEEKSVC